MSIWHALILLVILLLIFGPQRLEGIGVSLGKAVGGFKKGLEEGSVQSKGESPSKTAASAENSPTTPKV